MPSLDEAYAPLVAALQRQQTLGSVSALLDWDEQVLLPPESAGQRAEQSALLADLLHREASRPEIGEWLSRLEAGSPELSADQRAVIREARRDYDQATRLPAEFVQRRSKAKSAGYHAWVEARKNDDFSKFLPFLREHLALAREEAALMGAEAAYPYWIDQFDPGMDEATISRLFGALQPELQRLVGLAQDSGVRVETEAFRGFPEAGQELFATEVVKALGFDLRRGRIDRSVHPFCSGNGLDTRLTTRYLEDDPLESLFSVVHEGGHGMYEQGLPQEHFGTALGVHCGMAVHESQSRLWENMVGRSRAFWQHWEPRYREIFPDKLAGLSSEQLYLAVNRVAISPIRVSADEVTYNLHIMLRFSLEKKLFSGELAPEDLPDGWNAESERILGYRPRNNREGCLQDVHWSCGLFGYFPSYCLGNLIAATWWDCLQRDIPDLESRIARGDYAALLGWLRQNVHRHGRRYRTAELVERVSGAPLSHEALVRYLKGKLEPLYGS